MFLGKCQNLLGDVFFDEADNKVGNYLGSPSRMASLRCLVITQGIARQPFVDCYGSGSARNSPASIRERVASSARRSSSAAGK